MDNMWLLAQGTTEQAPARIGSEPVDSSGQTTTTAPGGATTTPETAPKKGPAGWTNIFFLALIMIVMFVVMFRGPRKQQQQHKQMVQSLKKNDRVRTIGGIYGIIMDVKDDEVVLKIDEATNTKIRVSTSAIGKNLTQEGKE